MSQSLSSKPNADITIATDKLPTEKLDSQALVEPPYWSTCLWIADVIVWLIIVGLLNGVLFFGTEISYYVRVPTLLLLAFCIYRLHGWVILLAIQARLWSTEWSQQYLVYDFLTIYVSLVTLGMLSYSYSPMTIRNPLRFWLAAMVYRVLEGRNAFEVKHIAQVEKSLVLRFGWHVLLTLVTMLLFSTQPRPEQVREKWWELSAQNGLLFWPGPTIVLIAVGGILLLGIWDWRQIEPSQARLYMRSLLVKSHYRELRDVAILRLRRKRKENQ